MCVVYYFRCMNCVVLCLENWIINSITTGNWFALSTLWILYIFYASVKVQYTLAFCWAVRSSRVPGWLWMYQRNVIYDWKTVHWFQFRQWNNSLKFIDYIGQVVYSIFIYDSDIVEVLCWRLGICLIVKDL